MTLYYFQKKGKKIKKKIKTFPRKRRMEAVWW